MFSGSAMAEVCAPIQPPSPAVFPDFKKLPKGLVIRDAHDRTTGVLWFQTAAEYRVDSLAKYRQAASALDQALADHDWTAATEQTAKPFPKPTAVIMDLDETVLDNSRFQGELVKRREGYNSAAWKYWVSMEEAGLVPGALQFIEHAKAKGVTVFFVTNRTSCMEAATRSNLIKLGIKLPDPSASDTVLTSEEQGWTSDKTDRRAYVAKSYRVLLLIGDDLNDFVASKEPLIPPAPTPADRTTLAEKYLDQWGTRWFLISNPLYGSWETATNSNNQKRDDAILLQEKNDLVKGFKP
ncbi:5'-nucleotidase, lipoprotein e(P4) family [Sphingomonas sp. CFBP 8760]|uniref:5'-nucleotidase, lipoprotein e(P4) family n=1 Tax=Sphingomonas sp. CFBP 8760 TaxID=2775282 RepID=UPI001FCEE80A|nr:HAD family acid phosphatase [Sphingomonas sp. CFBP 8760]